MRLVDIKEAVGVNFDPSLLWSLPDETRLALLNKHGIQVADMQPYTINKALHDAVKSGAISEEEILANSPFKTMQDFRNHQYEQRRAREEELKAAARANAPKITYRQNGDGSWTMVVDKANGDRVVHSNKNKSNLEQLAKDRYQR